MTDRSASPRRRHILSSINPDEPRKRPRNHEPRDHDGSDDGYGPKPPGTPPAERTTVEADAGDGLENTTKPRRSRLRLKDHKSSRRSSRKDADGPSASTPSSSSHPLHRSRHRRRHRHRSATPPNPFDAPALDPEAAFRESLFDAMADDEGAAYWEGVYGQPVHVFSADKIGPRGELERMTEDEYAAHVRQKMWEKTHAGLLEERARRDEERQQRRQEKARNRELQEEMERSLRKGEERREAKRWARRWDDYLETWAAWDGSPDRLAWPVESGKPCDLDEEAVRTFYMQCLRRVELGDSAFANALKSERVRWHPDKIQQKLGGAADDETMRHVTSIFQIIDRLWTDTRPVKSTE